MFTSDVFLPNIDAVKKFVILTNKYTFPVNLATDKYKIDAKSIMGIFSLDLSKPLRLEVDDTKIDKNEMNEFAQQLQQFHGASENAVRKA
jgi:phosphotransferase system HPr-like phosphotransfer protein